MITLSAPLQSTLGDKPFFSSRVAFAPRADATSLIFLGVPDNVADTVTTTMMGVLNGCPTIRHESGATPGILALIARSGIEVSEDMRTYATPQEAEAHARDLIRDGYQLAWPYPPRKGRYPKGANLVTPHLWRHLNSKQNLSEIVPEKYLAERALVKMDAAGPPDVPVPCYIKAGGDMPTGMGYAVRCCENRSDVEAAWNFFKSCDGLHELIVEEAVPVRACWCVSLAIDDDAARYLGAAEQLFSSPAHQIGNLIDDDDPFPEEGIRAAVAVGEKARAMGFRGPAGLDIGVTRNGRVVVFDPNFRPQGSTLQSLFHSAAAKRSGLRASRSLHVNSSLSIKEAERILRAGIDAGHIVINRAIDGRYLPSLQSESVITGFVLGADRQDAIQQHEAIMQRLDPKAPA